jgi:hypothetical protein
MEPCGIGSIKMANRSLRGTLLGTSPLNARWFSNSVRLSAGAMIGVRRARTLNWAWSLLDWF